MANLQFVDQLPSEAAVELEANGGRGRFPTVEFCTTTER